MDIAKVNELWVYSSFTFRFYGITIPISNFWLVTISPDQLLAVYLSLGIYERYRLFNIT